MKSIHLEKCGKKLGIVKFQKFSSHMLLICSLTFLQAALVAFFGSLADVGLHASLMVLFGPEFHSSEIFSLDI